MLARNFRLVQSLLVASIWFSLSEMLPDRSGNMFAVAGSMGHDDLKSMEPYQHHDPVSLHEAINRRNEIQAARPELGRVLGHVGQNRPTGWLGEELQTIEPKQVPGGPGGIRTPNQGIMSPLL